jgi:exonuclease V gamma subunit
VGARLQGWTRHLALQLGPDGPRATELFGHAEDGVAVVVLPPLDPARAHELLSSIVELYLQGHAAPLRFAPDLGAALLEGGARAARRYFDALSRNRPGALVPWDRLVGGTAWLDDPEAVTSARAAAATILQPLFAAEA